MLKLLYNLVSIKSVLSRRIRAIQAHTEAMAFYNDKDYAKAMPLLQEASELGNAQAMAVLGAALLLGTGTRADGAAAMRWLQLAADNGQEDVASLMGMAYATGIAGIKPDHKRARSLLVRAAYNGDAKSAQMLDMINNRQGIFNKSTH